MSTLATLLIKLGFDTTSLRPGAQAVKSEVAGIGTSAASAGRQTEGSLAGVQQSLAKTGAIGKIASGALSVGLGLVAFQAAQVGIEFVKGIGTAIAEEDRLEKQTQAVIKSTKGAANVTAEWVKQYAHDLQTAEGANQDVVMSAENMLLTFTQIKNRVGEGNDIFNQATQAALNMSTVFGTDAARQSIQLGKALNDPIIGATALRRVGVMLTQQQMDQIKVFQRSGDIMSAQKLILKELETEFGGSAEAFGNSAAGMAQRFDNAVKDIQRGLGAVLLPVLEGIVTGVTWVVTNADKLIPVFAGIGAVIMAVLVPALLAWLAAMIPVAIATVVATAPLILLGLAVAAAVIAFQNIKGVRTLVENVFGVIGNVVKGFVGTMLTVAGTVVGVIAALPGPLQEGAKAAQKTLDDLRKTVDAWGTETKPIGEAAGDKVGTAMGAGVAAGLAGAEPEIKLSGQQLIDTFGSDLNGVRDAAARAGGDAMLDMAKGILAKETAPLEALKTLHGLVQGQMTRTQRLALLAGELTSVDLAKGLVSKDPAVLAAATATLKLITGQMTELGADGEAAGKIYTDSLATGLLSPESLAKLGAATTGIRQLIEGTIGKGLTDKITETIRGLGGGAVGNIVDHFANGFKITPVTKSDADKQKELLKTLGLSGAEYAKAVAEINRQMKLLDTQTTTSGASARRLASEVRSSIGSAFDAVRQKANQFFDAVHNRNMQMIDDRQKELQGPITAAQAALKAIQDARQLRDLTEAVANASSPEEQQRATESLTDFQVQQQIDAMQKSADAQINVAKDAENKRYSSQQSSFETQLYQLETYLSKHPKEWKSTQDKIIALLKSYDVSYTAAGALLGNKFLDGLKESVKGIGPLIHELLTAPITVPKDNTPKDTPKDNTVFGVSPGYTHAPGRGPQEFDVGAWNVASDMLAMIHKGEMIVPRTMADSLRGMLKMDSAGATGMAISQSKPTASADTRVRGQIGAAGSVRASESYGGTIIVKVGNETLVEIVDRRLKVSQDIHAPTGRVWGGSER